MQQSECEACRRLVVEIHGAVQGVGFRPFVYRLATELALTGWVINDTAGRLHRSRRARQPTLQRFLARLPAEAPPRAHHPDLSQPAWLDPAGYETLRDPPQRRAGRQDRPRPARYRHLPRLPGGDVRSGRPAPPLPLHQLHQLRPALQHHRGAALRPAQHHHAPVHACAPTASAEYENPLDRRFHAQPNACPVCGPRLTLWTTDDRRPKADDRAQADLQSCTRRPGRCRASRRGRMPSARARSSRSRGWAGFI